MKNYIAELIGTFALVFCGTGAIVIDTVTEGAAIGHIGVAITFGLIVMAMIYALGNVSGAHINPAVTMAFALTDRFDRSRLVGYVIAQLIGALVASGCLYLIFDAPATMGETLPFGSWYQSFVLEIILTYLLMLVILFVSQNTAVTEFTGVAVGATVLLEAMFAGPITGASMNPARSIAPAIFAGDLSGLWIYILAPIVGAALASFTWNYMKPVE